MSHVEGDPVRFIVDIKERLCQVDSRDKYGDLIKWLWCRFVGGEEGVIRICIWTLDMLLWCRLGYVSVSTCQHHTLTVT